MGVNVSRKEELFMRKIPVIFFSALLLVPLLPMSNAQVEPQYQFITHYEAPESEELKDIADIASEAALFDEYAAIFTDSFVLPRDVHIVTMECGTSNAFYSSENSAIILCYEFFNDIFNLIEYTGEDPALVGGGTIVFVFFHELGHALIDIYDIDILAAEEDAADAFATLLTIYAEIPEMALGAARWWELTATEPDVTDFADEHSLNQQRFFNILCLVYGSNPEEFSMIVEAKTLPERRANRCPSEFSQASQSFDNMLSPHIREEVRESAAMAFDRDEYTLRDDREAIISVNAPDANTMKRSKDAIDVFIYSTSDPIGIIVKVSETGPDTGIFEKAIQLKTINLSPGDTLTAQYVGSFGGITSISATIIFGGTDGSEPPTPTVQPNFDLYRSDEYGFSIEYPEDWFVDDEIIQEDNWTSIVAFSPNSRTWDPLLDITLIQDDVEYKNLVGQQYLDKLIEDHQTWCDSVSLAEEGFTCSNFEMLFSDFDTNDIKIGGKQEEILGYVLGYTYTTTWSDGESFEQVYLAVEIPIENDTWTISLGGSVDDIKSYLDITIKMLDTFELLNGLPEPAPPGEGKPADVSVAMKHKKKVTLVAVKNNGDEEVFGVEMKIDDGKIRYVKARGWDRDRIDPSTVIVQTLDRSLKPGGSLIMILVVDNRASSFEWTVFDTTGMMMATGDVTPKS